MARNLLMDPKFDEFTGCAETRNLQFPKALLQNAPKPEVCSFRKHCYRTRNHLRMVGVKVRGGRDLAEFISCSMNTHLADFLSFFNDSSC